jgi:uncharacterized protein YdeI (YjbR/CyaY-like superfamily)
VKVGNTLHVTTRKDWRAWLARHHKTETEIWLVYYRKETGKPRITYNDAVEEALRYGWIDSIIRTLDKERFAQRFSKRRKASGLSQMNKERVRALIAQKKMTRAGLAAIAHAFDPVRDEAADFAIPPDILKPLKENEQAWENLQKLPEGYRRIRIAFIETRKRHGKKQFERSLRHFIDVTAKGKRFGFVREMR